MLLIDGVKYELWTPPSEDEFEQVVKEHTQEIFGEQSIYLDRKQKLRSLSGISSIPDGYVIVLGGPPQWHIIEIELSSHPLHDHIVSQIGRFISGIGNTNIQRGIVNAIDEEIARDEFIKFTLRKAIAPTEIYKFLSELISKPPVLTILIEKRTEELEEALGALRHPEINVVEFQTFTREGIGLAVHAHLFEPLYKAMTVPPVSSKIVKPEPLPSSQLIGQGTVEVIVSGPKDHYFNIPTEKRTFFPGFKVPFILETDIGDFKTCVVGAKIGAKSSTAIGDPNAGHYLSWILTGWFNKHPAIKVGDNIRISVIEPMKKYRLEIVK